MTRHFIFTVLSLFIAMTVAAQDDDMYFTPKRQKTNTTVRTPRSEVSNAYDYSNNYDSNYSDDNSTYHSGSIRNVDEYNRRGRYSTQQSWRDTTYYANDSILVSREDYENSRRMKRFDGYNNVTLIVGDPWYYDSWAYDPWYNGSWYWRTHWYDPWYVGVGWHDGWYSGWGYHHSWYRPAHYYGGWHGNWYRPVGRPSMGRPNNGAWQRPGRNYITNRPGIRITNNNSASRITSRIINNTPPNSQRNTFNNNRSTFTNENRSSFSSGRSTFSGGSRGGFSGGSRSTGGNGSGLRRR